VGNGESCSLLVQPVHVLNFVVGNVSEPKLSEEFDSHSEDICHTESLLAKEEEPGGGSPLDLAMTA
jgi:hypothetical protein